MPEADIVTSNWARILRWVRAHAPESAAALRPPATQEEIDRLSESLGTGLPEALRAWLSISNGSTVKDEKEPIPGGGTALLPHPDSALFPDGCVFLGCEEIAREHADYLHIAEDMGDEDYWKPQWIPVVQLSDVPEGLLIDAETGGMMSFAEGSTPDAFPFSLGEILRSMADVLETGQSDITYASQCSPSVRDGRLSW
ncbi:SMI1/KNR4 family protein [Streptomyces sp. TRM 70351]|uniref:SMI1/KNR4 family protein n=1 Tax=Streptomyces sp. TRM 70351 TaxID=3116552 RepID=UPI002E7BD7E9|nr:SMI1/KNR4 family protein [Streptomyces sp. TRM 70351]MEE1930331.1 SMI1/KNR4 family protein [Streptomyces sp. TRM 70351]